MFDKQTTFQDKQIDPKATMIAAVQVQINIVRNVSHFFFERRECN